MKIYEYRLLINENEEYYIRVFEIEAEERNKTFKLINGYWGKVAKEDLETLVNFNIMYSLNDDKKELYRKLLIEYEEERIKYTESRIAYLKEKIEKIKSA